MARTSLKVNGKSHVVDADADCPFSMSFETTSR